MAGLLTEGLGIGILPASWAIPLTHSGDLRVLKIERPLAPLRYAFQWRSDDGRPLIGSMLHAVKACINFEVPVRWLQKSGGPNAIRPQS